MKTLAFSLLRSARTLFRRAALAFLLAAPAALASNQLRWELLEVPATAVAGTNIVIRAVVTNLGTEEWGGAHNLVMYNSTPLPVAMVSLAGTGPGQTRTFQIDYGFPPATGVFTFGFQALEHEVETFGEMRYRAVTVSAPPPYTGMQLSATTFDRMDPARLSTTDSIVNWPPYRLRAKVIDGTAWGWHAANRWNVNGEALDNPPPAGSYAVCSLYWVRYSTMYGDVIGIGPERFVPLTISGPVALTSTWFHASSPPRIYSSENFAGTTYRLFATFRNALGDVWETSDGFNNHQRPLANLPPAGEYTVELYWRKYDSAQRVTAAGPVRTATVMVTEGPLLRLAAGGAVTATEWHDDEEDVWHVDYSSDYHPITVNLPGVLRVKAPAASGGEMYLNIYGPDGGHLRNGGRELEVPVQPGDYVLQVTAGHATSYTTTAELYPYAAKPAIAGADAVRSGAGVPFAGYTVTGTGTGPLIYGAPDAGATNGLPPGLTLNPQTGAIAGTPTEPGTYPVWVTVANPAGATGKWVLFTIFERPEAVLSLEGARGPDSGLLAVDWSGRLPAAAQAPNPGDPAPTGAVRYTAVRVPPGSPATEAVAVPGGLPASLTAHYGELQLTATYDGDANYAPTTRTVVFAVPDTQPPVGPANPNFQTGVVRSTGFSVAWSAFIDASGTHGGWPSHGITYEASLDAGAQTQVSTAQGATFNGLAPGSTHSLRLRARDAFGNWSAWHPTGFTITLPAADPGPGAASTWADVNGDRIRDELISEGERLAVFAAESRTETYSYTTWHWEFLPQLGVSLRDGWNLFAGGSWQWVPEDVTYHLEMIRPGFQFAADPGYDYAVVWSTRGPPPGNLPRWVPFFPPAEYVPPGAAGGAVQQEVLAGNLIPAESFHFFPTQLVRFGKPIGTVRNGGFGVTPAATAAAAGVLPIVLGSGSATISVTDAVGQILKAGSQVAWEIWNGVVRLAGGTASGGMIDLGLNAAGQFQLGLKLDDSTTMWLNLAVTPAPSGRLAGPSHMWINNDDDANPAVAGDIPGGGGADYFNGQASRGFVDGPRDLVDFFPVTFEVREYLAAYPPSGGARYRLRQADGALNFAYTNLAPAQANSYHSEIYPTGFGDNFDEPAAQAGTWRIPPEGKELSRAFLDRIASGQGGVLLIEGRTVSDRPLELVIERPDGALAAVLQLPLRISPVEEMFRHVNLRDTVLTYDRRPVYSGDPGEPGRLGDRQPAWPDAKTNGKYFVFVHGYKVDGQQARGWAAEMFKRLHQSGSRARFVAVSWHGSTGYDYHQAVFHAFQTGDILAARLQQAGITGDVTVAAHSLGNVVVSHAIQSGNFSPTRYFMINAAVAAEAYDALDATVPDAQRTAMTESKWTGYPVNEYATNWHRLFTTDPSDRRQALTWRNRFPQVANLAYNFYSPGEDVLSAPLTNSASLIEYLAEREWGSSRGAWALSELVKGATVTQSLSALVVDRMQGGWGLNSAYSLKEQSSPDPKRMPYFRPFLENDLFDFSPYVASNRATQPFVQYDLLARGLPALSFPAGQQEVFRGQQTVLPGRNINLESVGRRAGIWPNLNRQGLEAGRWLHSDIREIALPYVRPAFDHFITLGNLQ